MKLHRHLVEKVLTIIEQVFFENRYADKSIERLFRENKKLGARDRRFIAESAFDITRWWRLLWALMGKDPSRDKDDLWELFETWQKWKSGEAPIPEKIRNNRAIRESIPDWIDQLCESELGVVWDEVLPALNRQAPVVLRTNTLKTTREELQKDLAKEEIRTHPVETVSDALQLEKRANVFRTDVFKKGYFEVQDSASQLVAAFTEPEPGMRVVDACAGAGGKSLHLASLMKNKGKIISLDIYAHKLQELRKRASRDGVDIIETKPIESSKTIKRLENIADRVLLDVPCTGLGVLRRNPDTKWKLTREEVDRLMGLQREILLQYHKMVKVGGWLVYSTCSLLPLENEKQIEWFLGETDGTFELIGDRKILPHTEGFDGFYMAKLKRVK